MSNEFETTKLFTVSVVERGMEIDEFREQMIDRSRQQYRHSAVFQKPNLSQYAPDAGACSFIDTLT